MYQELIAHINFPLMVGNVISAGGHFFDTFAWLLTIYPCPHTQVLLEKILRAFPDISKVYILVRPKKELSIEERVQKLLQSPVFGFIHHATEQLDKVVPIAGNVSSSSLGLSDADRITLQENVSVVFHAAASIRFDSPLAEHLDTNVLGTKYLLQLCKTMSKFRCLVFCSTAFSNCQLKDVDEQLYPLQYSVHDVLQLHK